ncbi:MAG: hypothetical protein AAF480_02005 [Actinomycetota bacterium]
MQAAFLAMATKITNARASMTHKVREERGEGIVSVAIAVLIMAALGVVAYGAFDVLFNNTTDAAETQIGNIGN